MAYATKNKIGKIITVFSDARGVGCNSTTAAILAAGLAARGKKVLLLTTDPDSMDAVSYLSDQAMGDTTLDDMMLLANSNGLTKVSDFDNYVIGLSDSLDAARGSSKFERLPGDTAECLLNIIDLAQYRYHFIVLDLQGRFTQVARTMMEESHLVVYSIGQSAKQIDNLIEDRVLDPDVMNEEAYAMFIAANYEERDFLNVKWMEKKLKQTGFYTISHDEQVMKSGSLKNLYPLVEKAVGGGGKGGFFGFGGKKTASAFSSEVSAIIDLIMESLIDPEEEVTASGRKRKKFKRSGDEEE